MTSKKYDLLSPDGIPIHPTETYSSLKEVKVKFDEWVKRYERQGYYSSVYYGRIPLSELKNYCKVVSA
jgi:hypothetical protein